MSTKVIFAGAALLVVAAAIGLYWENRADADRLELLNVSYDPTRELWQELNAEFASEFEARTGKTVVVRQSHGGSTTQARALADGLPADVVTLALWPDTDVLRQYKLLADNWEQRLPHRSVAYFSTIVFVVRQGNPKNIKDWPDLARPDVGVVTPNPKTSGNGKLSYLAAYGSVRHRGGSEAEAQAFVKAVYDNVRVLDAGARGATVTFAQRQIGDVHLTWENEARLEVHEAKGALEIVYPPASIKAEPYVAWVDAVVRRKGTEPLAKYYLDFLYTPRAQEIIARHYYRPIDAKVRAAHRERFPDITLFPITTVAADWDEVQAKFFADGALFDQMYRK
jgi:sulfate transport system substrate-binding protein